jgi:hypothetical protein
MSELFKPRGAAKIRQPTTDQQQNGQVVNPPRFAHLGGLSGVSKTSGKNKFQIKKPGDGQKVI